MHNYPTLTHTYQNKSIILSESNHRSGMGIRGDCNNSGKFVVITDNTTIHTDNIPIQFCLYGATISSRNFSFDIDPSIVCIYHIFVCFILLYVHLVQIMYDYSGVAKSKE